MARWRRSPTSRPGVARVFLRLIAIATQRLGVKAAHGLRRLEGAKPGRACAASSAMTTAAARRRAAATRRRRRGRADRLGSAPPGTCCWSQRAWGRRRRDRRGRRRRRVDHEPRRRPLERRRERRAPLQQRLGLHGHHARELRRDSNDGGRRAEPRRQRVGRVGRTTLSESHAARHAELLKKAVLEQRTGARRPARNAAVGPETRQRARGRRSIALNCATAARALGHLLEDSTAAAGTSTSTTARGGSRRLPPLERVSAGAGPATPS